MHVALPPQALDAEGRPLTDAAGFQRDTLPPAAPTASHFGTKMVWHSGSEGEGQQLYSKPICPTTFRI